MVFAAQLFRLPKSNEVAKLRDELAACETRSQTELHKVCYSAQSPIHTSVAGLHESLMTQDELKNELDVARTWASFWHSWHESLGGDFEHVCRKQLDQLSLGSRFQLPQTAATLRRS